MKEKRERGSEVTPSDFPVSKIQKSSSSTKVPLNSPPCHPLHPLAFPFPVVIIFQFKTLALSAPLIIGLFMLQFLHSQQSHGTRMTEISSKKNQWHQKAGISIFQPSNTPDKARRAPRANIFYQKQREDKPHLRKVEV